MQCSKRGENGIQVLLIMFTKEIPTIVKSSMTPLRASIRIDSDKLVKKLSVMQFLANYRNLDPYLGVRLKRRQEMALASFQMNLGSSY